MKKVVDSAPGFDNKRFIAIRMCPRLHAVRKASYPHTVWTDRNIKGTVSGKVVSSMDRSLGVEGAYVALVDAMSPGREYANTTTGANGEFSIGGVGATYSSMRQTGPDGSAGTLSQGMSMFMLTRTRPAAGRGTRARSASTRTIPPRR